MESTQQTASFEFEGFLHGHGDIVTSIVAGNSHNEDVVDDDTILVSGSRDKTLIIWNLQKKEVDGHFGEPEKCLTGHNHFVSDLSISNDNNYVISSSWDKTLRLWDIKHGRCLERFVGHDKEIHTVTFSLDNRQILTGGSDRDLRLWNTLGQCKVVSEENNHSNWVSKIRYSRIPKNSYYVSVGRDGRLKIWTGIFKLYASIKAHENYINALALNVNGQFIATGGKDQTVKIWNYNDLSKPAIVYKTDAEVNALAFNTEFRWICAALDNKIQVWDLNSKEDTPILSIEPQLLPDHDEKLRGPKCTSVAWSGNSKTLYVGCSDGVIRVYSVSVGISN